MSLHQFVTRILFNFFLHFDHEKTWIRIRIHIDLKCWIRIRIEINTDPKHCPITPFKDSLSMWHNSQSWDVKK